MAIFLGSLNRSASRAAVQPPADDPVVDEPVTDQDWDTPPDGYTTVFFDDFSQPVSGTVNGFESWEGIDRSKWEVTDSKSKQPDGTGINDTDRWKIRSHNAIVPAGGLCHLYGGRIVENSPGPNRIRNSELCFGVIGARTQAWKPSSSAPSILRFRQRWIQRKHYELAPWTFGSWKTITVGGVQYQIGWEHDLETKGSEYDPVNRTFVPHFNNHIWHRQANDFSTMRSQQCPMKVTVPLPTDPDAEITIEVRWRLGPNFWDAEQTYMEWFTDEIVDGVSTGNMIRRYHWSPQHLLWISRFKDVRNGTEPTPTAIPGYLAAVAPSNNFFPRNPLPNTSPYAALGSPMFKPLMSAQDSSWTFFDVCREAWNDAPGGAQWWNGFMGSGYFLGDSGDAFVSDYDDHYSHQDDARAFACPLRGMAIFHPS